MEIRDGMIREDRTALDFAEDRFSTYHPLVLVTFFGTAIIATMLASHPVLAAVSWVLAFVVSMVAEGPARALGRLILIVPIIGVVTVANMYFVVLGSTELFSLGDRIFTLEATIFGVTTGLMLTAMLMWFAVAQRFIRNDDLLSLTSGVLPTLSLMVSMLFKLVPDFVRRAGLVSTAREALDPGTPSAGGRIRSAIDTSSVLVSWTMEDSLDTTDSMRARGYGAARRTSYRERGMKPRDIRMLIWMIVGGVSIIAATLLIVSRFRFYPEIADLGPAWTYPLIALYLLTPALVMGWGWLTWKLS